MPEIKSVANGMLLFGTCCDVAQLPVAYNDSNGSGFEDPQPTWQMNPGEVKSFVEGGQIKFYTFNGGWQTKPALDGAYFYFYTSPAWSTPHQTPFWKGRIHNEDSAEVDVVTRQVTIQYNSLRQAALTRLQAIFPDDTNLKNLDLATVREQSKDKFHDGRTAAPGPNPVTRSVVSPCNWAKAMLVVDAIFIVTGGVAIRSRMNPSWIEKVAEACAPQMVEIEKIAMRLGHPKASLETKAKAAFAIVKLVYTGGLFEAIFRAFLKSLTWWDMVFYGVLGLTEIVAAVATDGTALIALWVSELALVGFIASDFEKAKEECQWTFAQLEAALEDD